MSFNQDSSCFACARENGFVVYNCDPCTERFNRIYDDDECNGIGIVEMVNRSNILALVGGGRHPKYPRNNLMLWDDFQYKCIAELEFKSEVTGVKLTKELILAMIADKAYLYNFNDLHLLKTFDTCLNNRGVGVLVKNIVAVPGNVIGSVIIDTHEKQHIITAHTTSLARLALSPDGTMLATASERGTLIRVWDVVTGKMIKELRRGLEVVEITSLCFNSDSSRLLVSSEKGTVHVFSLLKEVTNKKSNLAYISEYLPSYFASEWSFVSFEIPGGSQCTFGKSADTIYVVTPSNRFLRYTYNTANSTAECVESVELDRITKK